MDFAVQFGLKDKFEGSSGADSVFLHRAYAVEVMCEQEGDGVDAVDTGDSILYNTQYL